MFIKESDAITKWCPMARSAFREHKRDSLTVINRPFNSATLCIGSLCVIWQEHAGDEGVCGLVN